MDIAFSYCRQTDKVLLARFMSSDTSVPEDVRSKYANEWGLCGDEFAETSHMSPQLYIREARRLVGETVFTQNSALDKTPRGNESIGMGCCERAATVHQPSEFLAAVSAHAGCFWALILCTLPWPVRCHHRRHRRRRCCCCHCR
jgi:hypothetical protein